MLKEIQSTHLFKFKSFSKVELTCSLCIENKNIAILEVLEHSEEIKDVANLVASILMEREFDFRQLIVVFNSKIVHFTRTHVVSSGEVLAKLQR